MHHCLRQVLLATAAIAVVASPPPGSLQAADVRAARAAFDAKFASQLADLAAWCEQHDQSAVATWTKDWVIKRDPNKLYIYVLPDALNAPPQIDASPALKEWWEKMTDLRRQQADELFGLAGQALAENQLSRAYELLREAVHENPDHEKARDILGYERHDGHWVAPYAAKRLARGDIYQNTFGWIPAADLPRYEKGERPFRDVWRPAAEDAKAHAAAKASWRIESEHYIVSTNHSLEAGVTLSRQLERLNEIWRQVFVAYYMNETELAKRYQGIALPKHDVKQHLVTYFRNRDNYIAALKTSQPLIDKTLGYYRPENQTVYFFAGDDQDVSTLYHEATHQLFLESRATIRDPGRKNNFWAIEAIACYMESLTPERGYDTLGGAQAGRVPAARQRVLVDGFYVSLDELTPMSRDAMQHDARLPKLYSQSAGLATFLMHDHDGRYRGPLIDYLIDIYSNRADNNTLSKRCGAKNTELDEQYREFMKRLVTDRGA